MTWHWGNAMTCPLAVARGLLWQNLLCGSLGRAQSVECSPSWCGMWNGKQYLCPTVKGQLMANIEHSFFREGIQKVALQLLFWHSSVPAHDVLNLMTFFCVTKFATKAWTESQCTVKYWRTITFFWQHVAKRRVLQLRWKSCQYTVYSLVKYINLSEGFMRSSNQPAGNWTWNCTIKRPNLVRWGAPLYP